VEKSKDISIYLYTKREREAQRDREIKLSSERDSGKEGQRES
jgi:hypothetical protein